MFSSFSAESLPEPADADAPHKLPARTCVYVTTEQVLVHIEN